jgi:nitrite reductase/ring-hydroxylating ferredoxin subunit/uncharacterized membrane protein
MLVSFPFAFLTGAFLFNAASRYLKKPELARTGGHLTAAGIGAGLLAGVPGAVDYFSVVPPNSSGSTRATKHAIANITALTLFGLSWALRRGRGATGATLTAQAAGVGMMSVGGWMGGTLVYRNQIGVDHRYADAGKWQETTLDPTEQGLVRVSDSDLGVNQMKLVRAAGARVVVARTEEGYAAFDDRCTHKGGPLSDGALICGTVQCPWHGSQFDVETGEVKCGPAKKEIATYEVKESNNQVLLGFELRAAGAVQRAKDAVHDAEQPIRHS